MLRMGKILVPVDLSVPSMLAVEYAGALARRLDASVTLLHAGASGNDVRQKLEILGHSEFGSLPFSTVALEGDAARVVVEYAASERFDLIVMATHGYGPFRSLLLGSVTTKVLDETERPVFTGTHIEQAVAGRGVRFDNIVCAVDLGPKTEEVMRWAGDFAAGVEGRLFLLHIVPNLEGEADFYFRPDANFAPASEAYTKLTEVRDSIGLSAKVIVAGGGIPEAISRQASDLRADVLIAGRGIRRGLLGRLRSNVHAIIRSAPCPVITL